MPTVTTPPARRLCRASRAAQVALGLLWLIDGALQCQPVMFGRLMVTDVLLPNAAGQPAVIGRPITWTAHLIGPHVALFNAFAAALQLLIGAGLLHRRTVRAALLASFAWALGIWLFGEGLGGIFSGAADPLTGAPGAAVLYVVVGLMCWPRASGGRLGLLGERGARAVWAAIWLGSAALWLMPANAGAGAAHDAIAAAPAGAGWLSAALGWAARATAGGGTPIAGLMACLSAMIAVAAMWRRNDRVFLSLGIAVSVVFWIVGQGLGGVFTGEATDVGTAPLMILIAVLMWRRPLRGVQRSRPREMTSLWMSEVPSSISSNLASRIHFSTGYSRE